VEETCREAMQQSGYTPVASPEITLLSGMAANEPIKYTAIFEIMPEVEVKGLEQISITLPRSEVRDEDVDNMVLTLRRQQGTFHEADKAAEDTDRVTVDFVGKLDGVAFDGGSGENMPVILGTGQMLPDFEAGLRGGKAGEEKTFDVAFPADYHSADLAGKTAQFTATIKKVEALALPEINEAFIKAFGIESGEQDAFRKAIRDNMTRELENAQRAIRRNRMFTALLEKNAEQLVPESLVRMEAEHMAHEARLEQQIEDVQRRREVAIRVFGELARDRVRMSLLVNKLLEERRLELDQARVDARIQSIAATYENPQEVVDWYKKDRETLRRLEAAILEEQLVDQLYEQAQVSEEDKTFQEVMALGQQRG
ncbi:MAG: trigger factor, partial [Cardiobacterium sp.]